LFTDVVDNETGGKRSLVAAIVVIIDDRGSVLYVDQLLFIFNILQLLHN